MEGPEGLRGPTGPTGIAGIVGTQGERGVPGGNGSIGMTGMQGSQGLQGLPGISVTPMCVQILYSTSTHDLRMFPAGQGPVAPHARIWSGSPALGPDPVDGSGGNFFSRTIRGMRVFPPGGGQDTTILLPTGTYHVEAGISVPTSSNVFEGHILFHNDAKTFDVRGSTFNTSDCPTSFLGGSFEVLDVIEAFRLQYRLSAGPITQDHEAPQTISVPFIDNGSRAPQGGAGLFVALIKT